MAGEDAATIPYREAMRGKIEINNGLELFENGKDTSVAMQQRLSVLFRDYATQVAALRVAVPEVPASARPMWERRLVKLGEEEEQLRTALSRHLGPMFREEDNRQELFGRRKESSEQSLLKENRGLEDAHSMLDSMLGQGQSTLDQMRKQNNVLKNAKRKMLDVANVMGLSSSLVGVIDRRQTVDKWIVYGGMVGISLLFAALWWLVRG
jgi:Golgi SNAP receptor complex protein 2